MAKLRIKILLIIDLFFELILAQNYYKNIINNTNRLILDVNQFEGTWHELYSHNVGQYCLKATFEKTSNQTLFKWTISQKRYQLSSKLYKLNADHSLVSEQNNTKSPLIVVATDYTTFAITYENITAPIIGDLEYFTIYGRKSIYFNESYYKQVVDHLQAIGFSKKFYTVYQGNGCSFEQNQYVKECKFNSTVVQNRIKLDINRFAGHWYSLYSTSLGQLCTEFSLNLNPSYPGKIHYEAFQAGVTLDKTELEFDYNENVCTRDYEGVKIPMNIYDTDYANYAIFYQSGKTSDGSFEYFAIHGRKPQHLDAIKLKEVKSKLNKIGFKNELYEVYQGEGCALNLTGVAKKI